MLQARSRSDLSLNVVQPLQSFGEHVAKGFQIGLVWDGAGDAKRQQTISRIKAVDGHLNTMLWAPFYLAKVMADHCRQLFSGLFSFALAGSGRPWPSDDSVMRSSPEFISPSPGTVDLLAQAPSMPSTLRRSFDRKSLFWDPELVVRSNLSVGG
jgi:hypothetical protein